MDCVARPRALRCVRASPRCARCARAPSTGGGGCASNGGGQQSGLRTAGGGGGLHAALSTAALPLRRLPPRHRAVVAHARTHSRTHKHTHIRTHARPAVRRRRRVHNGRRRCFGITLLHPDSPVPPPADITLRRVPVRRRTHRRGRCSPPSRVVC